MIVNPTPNELRSLDHLKNQIGAGGNTINTQNTCVVAASGLSLRIAEDALQTIESIAQKLRDWLEKLDIPTPPKPPFLAVGLFSNKKPYEAYLTKEGLGGLSGSFGVTHPVRWVSLILCDPGELKEINPQVVIAHESIHLITLKSRLCPAWDAWPRWLHEGLALLGDHTADKSPPNPTQKGPMAKNPAPLANRFGSTNQDRAKAWKTTSPILELNAFLRRDLIKNPLPNHQDYAACWAITAALAEWQNGRLLQSLIHELNNLHIQFEPPQSIEVFTADWLKSEIGDQWLDFTKSVRALADL
ncbi:MAG: DUF1570 domain-containing protein [Planctomycetota bacterium]|nr:DUF1570 domain-containing protein [Planctomycetota bacterium]